MTHFSAAAKKKLVSDFLNKRMFMYLDIFMVPVAYRLQLNPRVCAVLAAWLFIYLDFLPVWIPSEHIHVWPCVLYFFILWCPT